VTEKRTFESTHPHLRFSADLRNAPATFWITLGECQSKCEHIARGPLRPQTAKELYKLYLAKGVLGTTAIEGNTLTEDEVLQHLAGELKLPPSREYLRHEIDNIIFACNHILESIKSGEVPQMTVEMVCGLNEMVLRNLKLGDDITPGQMRRQSVTVGRYRGAPVEDCEHLLDRLCRWLSGADLSSRAGLGIANAILKAALAHLYIAWIHPLGDGNGRTARLLEFQILISSGVPAASAHLLSNHYNQTRSEYYRQLDQASTSGEVVPFLTYAVQGFLDGLSSQLEIIWKQQWDITWDNYVHEFFRDKDSGADRRRRHLVLDLSFQEKPVPLSALPGISPRLAGAYATKNRRTLARDVNFLCKAGLIEKTENGYRARKELILAFLSPRLAVRAANGEK